MEIPRKHSHMASANPASSLSFRHFYLEIFLAARGLSALRKGWNFRVILRHACEPRFRSKIKSPFAKIWRVACIRQQRLIILLYNIHEASNVPSSRDAQRQERGSGSGEKTGQPRDSGEASPLTLWLRSSEGSRPLQGRPCKWKRDSVLSVGPRPNVSLQASLEIGNSFDYHLSKDGTEG